MDKLYFPEYYKSYDLDGDCLLIDPERANWIVVNREGKNVLDKIGEDNPQSFFDFGDERVRKRNSFINKLKRQGWLSDEPLKPHPRKRAMGIDRLHEVWLTVHYKCNLRCSHCYVIDRVAHNRSSLSLENVRAVVDETRNLGAEIFYLTGGEPFLHEDIINMLKHITKRSRAVVLTNGTLITDKIADELEPMRDRLIIQISLEGYSEDINRRIRGKDSFNKALAGIKRLLNRKIRTGISSTPMPGTIEHIPELTKFLCSLSEDGYGIDYHHIIMPLEQGNAQLRGWKLTSDDVVEVITRCRDEVKKAKKNNRDLRLKITNDKIFKAMATNGPAKDLCGAGFTILGINADGGLHPCAATIHDEKYNLGRVLDKSGNYVEGIIEKLWREAAKVRRIRQFSISEGAGEVVKDLRYFHGGGCWYNFADPESDFIQSHPFAKAYEELTLRAIFDAARKSIKKKKDDNFPRLLASMKRRRITCAGARKTRDLSECGLDTGYCICLS